MYDVVYLYCVWYRRCAKRKTEQSVLPRGGEEPEFSPAGNVFRASLAVLRPLTLPLTLHPDALPSVEFIRHPVSPPRICFKYKTSLESNAGRRRRPRRRRAKTPDRRRVAMPLLSSRPGKHGV